MPLYFFLILIWVCCVNFNDSGFEIKMVYYVVLIGMILTRTKVQRRSKKQQQHQSLLKNRKRPKSVTFYFVIQYSKDIRLLLLCSLLWCFSFSFSNLFFLLISSKLLRPSILVLCLLFPNRGCYWVFNLFSFFFLSIAFVLKTQISFSLINDLSISQVIFS